MNDLPRKPILEKTKMMISASVGLAILAGGIVLYTSDGKQGNRHLGSSSSSEVSVEALVFERQPVLAKAPISLKNFEPTPPIRVKSTKRQIAQKPIQSAKQKKISIALLPTILPKSNMSGTAINLATYYGPKILDDIAAVLSNKENTTVDPYLLNVYDRTIKGVGQSYHDQASL